MAIIVQNFKTKAMSLSQVRTSTLRSETTIEASKLSIPLKASKGLLLIHSNVNPSFDLQFCMDQIGFTWGEQN